MKTNKTYTISFVLTCQHCQDTVVSGRIRGTGEIHRDWIDEMNQNKEIKYFCKSCQADRPHKVQVNWEVD